MPVITVLGVPSTWNQITPNDIKRYREKLLNAVLSVKELKLTPEQISIFCLPEKREDWAEDKEETIVIFVDGLFEKPERTNQVRNRLAENLGKATEDSFPQFLVECFVKPPFNPEVGFWTSAKTEEPSERASEISD
ncbi:hypothetical protein KJA16_01255 [Patescibacteria group bacterium]|nr:hypothetical protein [Patescibacteria group bacterium]